jgi:hypothetical protein
MRRRLSSIALLGLWMLAAIPWPSHATEVVLQYFGTSWPEIARRMPELAEAGYTSLWLPPPQKASGGLSVGFDTCDRFDLGHKSRNGLATKYGTLTDLVYMMEVAHRFGIRVYFDNIRRTPADSCRREPYQLNDLGFVPADSTWSAAPMVRTTRWIGLTGTTNGRCFTVIRSRGTLPIRRD